MLFGCNCAGARHAIVQRCAHWTHDALRRLSASAVPFSWHTRKSIKYATVARPSDPGLHSFKLHPQPARTSCNVVQRRASTLTPSAAKSPSTDKSSYPRSVVSDLAPTSLLSSGTPRLPPVGSSSRNGVRSVQQGFRLLQGRQGQR